MVRPPGHGFCAAPVTGRTLHANHESFVRRMSAHDRDGAPRPVPGWSAMSDGRYLDALRETRAALDDENPMSYDPLVYLLGALGRHEEALRLRAKRFELEKARVPKPWQLRQIFQSAKQGRASALSPRLSAPPQAPAEDAVPRLIDAIESHQVVILAEEHHAPEHRAFGAHCMGQFRAAGITHLALETGHQEPLDEAMLTGLVTPATEGFAFEPQRAGLLRAAIEAGVPIVAFDVVDDDVRWMQEHPDEAMSYREELMARNIRERILEKDAAAKVLVWVGMGHAQRRSGLGLKMMIDWLSESLNQEPFSGYQLTGTGTRPGVDLLIRHSDPTYTRSRPSWLRTPERVSVQGTVEPAVEYLVQLTPGLERGVTPTDQLLTSSDGAFELLAPPGDYALRIWSKAGLLHERALSLETAMSDLRVKC